MRIVCFLVSIVVLTSCGMSRHVLSDPLSKDALDRYARDHFYMEGVKMNNENHYDAAKDLMSHSLDYDTASAATCYSLAQYYMSLNDRTLVEK